MKKVMIRSLLGCVMALGLCGVALAQEGNSAGAEHGQGRSCRLKTLRGSYLFAASGFNIVGGVAQPKVIHEGIEFNGDGTLTVAGVSLSVNGVISHPPAGGVGDYVLDSDCRGTLVFVGGPSFDIVAALDGTTVWMLQTNPNTVFQGTATRLEK